jgi:hypothetical protein
MGRVEASRYIQEKRQELGLSYHAGLRSIEQSVSSDGSSVRTLSSAALGLNWQRKGMHGCLSAAKKHGENSVVVAALVRSRTVQRYPKGRRS